jgi:cyclopropane fatty-acyl-phospholipid synthase-like methyltransferase
MAACTFHAAMGELTSFVAAVLAERMRFASGALLADLGGGNGELLVGILAADASLRGLLFEMPHALADAQARIAAAGMQARIAVQSGDFFESVPAADVYLLKSVLHNWDDEHCIRLLARCRAAMGPPARLVVIERVRRAQPATGASARALARNDLNMLIGPGGRERSAAALERLFAAAGLRQVGAMALAHGLTALDLRAG